MRSHLIAVSAFFIVCCSTGWASEPTESLLSAKTFAHFKEIILPAPDEDQWAAIPWLTSLWQARERAAAEGKPILLWEMDGHPLGCT